MSFKDKPLKKIVSDKRITIDAIHQEISGDFHEQKKVYEENLIKRDRLMEQYKRNPSKEIKDTISEIEELISQYNPQMEINYYLDKFFLYDKRKSYPIELSDGQCQRISIIRAILNDPKIILADGVYDMEE